MLPALGSSIPKKGKSLSIRSFFRPLTGDPTHRSASLGDSVVIKAKVSRITLTLSLGSLVTASYSNSESGLGGIGLDSQPWLHRVLVGVAGSASTSTGSRGEVLSCSSSSTGVLLALNLKGPMGCLHDTVALPLLVDSLTSRSAASEAIFLTRLNLSAFSKRTSPCSCLAPKVQLRQYRQTEQRPPVHLSPKPV